MTDLRHVAVIDIGKTNAKLALVDMATLTEIAVVTRPNTVLPGPPWPHFDTEGHWAFLLDALKTFHREYGVDAISVTTHGASVALLDHHGDLAAPILDYEHPIPPEIAAAYDALRPAFDRTGSPRLAGGLNVGAQLHYQFAQVADLRARTAHIVGYPQYWGHRLTGVAANDVTSIGSHTDLWEPRSGHLSTLPARLGVADKIAPVRKSGDILGTLRPDIAGTTGLSTATPVVCGIHDSNASLYPHLMMQQGPFSVVSTGTWVIVMTMPGAEVSLDPARDTLINVNALGDPVPSARFMGGREFEVIQGGHPFAARPEDAQAVLAGEVMLLPAVEPSTGPFQGQPMRWHGPEPAAGSGPRAVALSWYLALMTRECLTLTGATGPTIVEGPFARNPHYLAMLSAAAGRPVLRSQSTTGTSIGAALLFGGAKALTLPDTIAPADDATDLRRYADTWTRRANADRHKPNPGIDGAPTRH
ncbi:FGGY-family carbohydrate kinase [Jannaschia pohangensis]|uniref:Sugar (Pentulose or hexulose) kinase n=1 Tax=Jannaschia pohangensis TaxID=390807 RepID=A0A1I3J6A2_9RHOB|nr:FGGY-family carbohydrate kinase [Jannaschia pohangensis]SFI55767.1 Sugar (pentulose or hexulose) kinase [Jannaschia pohangensis]